MRFSSGALLGGDPGSLNRVGCLKRGREHIEGNRPSFSIAAEGSNGVGLPGGKDIEVPWHRQDLMSHAGTKRLQMPILRTVETELTVKALSVDLWRCLEKDHA